MTPPATTKSCSRCGGTFPGDMEYCPKDGSILYISGATPPKPARRPKGERAGAPVDVQLADLLEPDTRVTKPSGPPAQARVGVAGASDGGSRWPLAMALLMGGLALGGGVAVGAWILAGGAAVGSGESDERDRVADQEDEDDGEPPGIVKPAEQPPELPSSAPAARTTPTTGAVTRPPAGPRSRVPKHRPGSASAARPGTGAAVAVKRSTSPTSTAVVPTSKPSPPPPSTPATTARGPKVRINGAGAAELDTLPGIGPAKAKAIVDYRTSHGPFKSVDELLNVSGIGPKTLETLRPLVDL